MPTRLSHPNSATKNFSHLIIRASAGTGKTFSLANRYLQLLASGVEVNDILASTFTKKGAGEILDRIVQRLSDAALDSKSAAELSHFLSLEITQQSAGELLLRLLKNLHKLEIGTLDSFFSRLARVFSLELGLPPGWEIVEQQQASRLTDQAITAVLQSESAVKLLHLISKGEAPRGVASLVHQTVQEIYQIFRESGCEPWDQVSRTADFLAEEQLEQVVEQLSSLELSGTLLPKQQALVLNQVQEKDWPGLAKAKSLQNILDGKETFGRSKMPPQFIEILFKLVQQCRAYQEEVLINQNHATRDLLTDYHQISDRLKSLTGDLRFDDVTERLQAFVKQWDADRCAYRLDHRIQHLLLDEFQDTSLEQWNVIKPFARRVTHADSEQTSFFCVGDMKQAIYGWRGGVAEIFDRVVYELDHLEEEELTKSYRSSPEVIDFVNRVFLNSHRYRCDDSVVERSIHQWCQWYKEHESAKQQFAGYVTIETADLAGDDSFMVNGLDRESIDDLELKTIQRVEALQKFIPANKTIGLICRTNSEVARLMSLLQQFQIPASDESGSVLTDSAAVDLILSAFSFADQPGDSVSRYHLSHSPLASHLGLIPETQRNQSESLRRGNTAADELRKQLMDQGYGETVEALAKELAPHCNLRELNRLQQLIEVAYSSSYKRDIWDLRPSRFADFVRKEIRVSDVSRSQIRVMTIHKAKGLEFDVVVLPMGRNSWKWSGRNSTFVVDRDTPTSPIRLVTRYVGKEMRKLLPAQLQDVFVKDNQREIREALCVLYVALTRAAQAIHIVVPANSKKDNKSIVGFLLATVCEALDSDLDTSENGLLYESGVENWFSISDQPFRDKSGESEVKIQNHPMDTKFMERSGLISIAAKSGRGEQVNTSGQLNVTKIRLDVDPR